MKRKIVAIWGLVGGIFLTAGLGVRTAMHSAKAETEHLISYQSFDGSLGGEWSPFRSDYELVSGGVQQEGKAAKVGADSFLKLSGLNFPNGEMTVNFWTNASSENYGLCSTAIAGNLITLRGGLFSCEADDSMTAWTNEDGGSVTCNDYWGGICRESEKGEEWFMVTIAVDRESVRFFKNAEIANCYYRAKDRENGAIGRFIDGFLSGLQAGELYFGSTVYDEHTEERYLIDDISVYDFSACSPSEIEFVTKANGEGYTDEAQGIYERLQFVPTTDVKSPLLHYDFNDAGEEDFKDAVSGATFKDGKMFLDWGELRLPDTLFSDKTDWNFTLSMNIESTFEKSDNPHFHGISLFQFKNKRNENEEPFIDAFYNYNGWLVTDLGGWDNTIFLRDIGKFNYTITFDGECIRTYINGVRWNKTPIANALPEIDGVSSLAIFDCLSIGNSFWDRAGFTGWIDDLYVFGETLNAWEVRTLSNRAEITFDLPVSVNEVAAALDYAKISLFPYEDRFAKLPGEELTSLFDSALDLSGEPFQKTSFKKGYTAYDVCLIRRDILDYVETKTVGAEYSRLPEKLVFDYSDGSTEELRVAWNEIYAASGAPTEYTGRATDSSGRTAEVSYTLSLVLDETGIRSVLRNAERYLKAPELYDENFYATYRNAVSQAVEALEENIRFLGTEEMNGERTAQVISAVNIVNEASELTEHSGRILYDYIYRFDATVEEISFREGKNRDVIAVNAEAIVLTLYDPDLETGYKITKSFRDERRPDFICVRILRNTALEKTIISVYATSEGEILASVTNETSYLKTSEAVIQPVSVVDYSLLNLLGGINEDDYTTESWSAYNRILQNEGIYTDFEKNLFLEENDVFAAAEILRSARTNLVYTKILSYEPFTLISCKTGTDISELLEKSVRVTYDNGATELLPVSWNLEALDTSAAGEKILTGTVVEKDGRTCTVSMTYTVVEKNSGTQGRGCKGCGSVTFGGLSAVVLGAAVLLTGRKRKQL